MKRIFVICLTTLMLLVPFSLTACFRGDVTISDKEDGDGVYYTAVNINAVTFPEASADESSHYVTQLQIGLRGDPINNSVQLANFLAEACGCAMDFVGYYNLNNSIVGVNYTDTQNENYYDSIPKNYYTFYCFNLRNFGTPELKFENSKFGFFHYRHNYKLYPPDKTIGKKDLISLAVRRALTWQCPNLIPDDNAISYNYYCCLNASVKSDDAENTTAYVFEYVESEYADESGYFLTSVDALRWREEFLGNELDLYTGSMAPGWYIVAIIAGAAIVGLLLLVCKIRKPKNGEPAMDGGTTILNDNVDAQNQDYFPDTEKEIIIEQDVSENKDADQR